MHLAVTLNLAYVPFFVAFVVPVFYIAANGHSELFTVDSFFNDHCPQG